MVIFQTIFSIRLNFNFRMTDEIIIEDHTSRSLPFSERK